MTRRPFIGGNWKTKISSLTSAVKLATEIKGDSPPKDSATASPVEVVIFPQDSHLYQVAEITANSNIQIGSQNIWKGIDPSTGELPIATLLDASGRYVLIGHSERRQFYGETNQDVNAKLLEVLKHNKTADPTQKIIPILCIGEDSKQKNRGITENVIYVQLLEALGMWNLYQEIPDYIGALSDTLIIAYEPVWAIGTGNTPSPEEVEKVHWFIRNEVGTMLSMTGPNCLPQRARELAENLQIIYGGSVSPANAKALIAKPNIDGFLIGGASLDSNSFRAIIQTVADNC